MIQTIQQILFYTLMVKLIVTLYQRRYNENGGKKRLASLYQSFLVGLLYASITIVISKGLPIVVFYITIPIVLVVSIKYRDVIFPYKSRCSNCSKKLKLSQILFYDNQKCPLCEN